MKSSTLKLTGLIFMIMPLFSFAQQLNTPGTILKESILKSDVVLEGTPYKFEIEISKDKLYDTHYFHLKVSDQYKGNDIGSKDIILKRKIRHYSRDVSHSEPLAVYTDVVQIFCLANGGELRGGVPVLEYIVGMTIDYLGCDHKVCGNGGLRYDDLDAFYGFLRDMKLNIPNKKFSSCRINQNNKSKGIFRSNKKRAKGS